MFQATKTPCCKPCNEQTYTTTIKRNKRLKKEITDKTQEPRWEYHYAHVLDIDEEDYPVPSDGMVEEEIEQGIEEYIYDIDGIKLQSIKTITE